MVEEKRMVDTYVIEHAIYIGDREILFGVDDTKHDLTYMVCNCSWDNPLGIERYSNAAGSEDYLEMMSEFAARVTKQLEAVKAERDKIVVPQEALTLEHCNPIGYGENIENKVVVIRPECLRPEYRTADKQLVLAVGGFGAAANARGRAVFTVNLYSGKESRWNREDILGTPEQLPDWAHKRLSQIQVEFQAKQRKRELVR